ncbi:sugar ABC transporter substrate-binding protein [Nocardiopsis sp. JB363]|uniref:ABC transporter substrate-binding protein n=1 Tax=Nocardiopsis sp. JB363 TaxID=1434837 RepID=UPI00097ABD14|nr:sugar ABC transporter substrate-binding protein [Nocardiopsis sp. JB363]SIO86195.1 L-arabinose-binding periplasmic protein precursor AraF (TC 3.A.1.2.2) [Nocardiopsis sp. JB363]
MNTQRLHPRRTAALGLAAAGAALALLTSACGSLTTDGAETESQEHTLDEGFHVGLLLPELQTARYEAFDRPYFEEALGDLCPECEFSYANADQDVDEQQTQAQAMLTDGVDVLVLGAVDSEAAAGTVNEAQSQGVPVVAYDRLAQGGADMYVSFDNVRVGQVQAEALIGALEQEGTAGDGSIVMINGSPSDPNAGDFKAGAHEIFEDQVEIGQEFDTPDWSPDEANSQMEGAITSLGLDEIVGVYSANDGMAAGIVSALRSAGVSVEDLPPVTGQDAELHGIQRIISGEQYMTVYKAIRPEAELAAAMAVSLATGEELEAGEHAVTETEDADGEMVPSVLLEPVSVTEENIGDTVVSDGFYSIEEICTSDYEDTDFCKEAL